VVNYGKQNQEMQSPHLAIEQIRAIDFEMAIRIGIYKQRTNTTKTLTLLEDENYALICN
jgi:PIN domain nuclease of toxin-antitoxin system